MSILKTNEDGFTFIEVMTALAIASITILMVLMSNTTLQKANDASYERSVAAQDANQVIERIRETAMYGEFPSNVLSEYPNNSTVANFSSLTNQQVTVSYADTSADPLSLTVTVSWDENGLRQVSKSVRALITQRVPSALNDNYGSNDNEEDDIESNDDHGDDHDDDHDDDDHGNDHDDNDHGNDH